MTSFTNCINVIISNDKYETKNYLVNILNKNDLNINTHEDFKYFLNNTSINHK